MKFKEWKPDTKNEANNLIKENVASLYSLIFFFKVQFYKENFQSALFKLEPRNIFQYFWNTFHTSI